MLKLKCVSASTIIGNSKQIKYLDKRCTDYVYLDPMPQHPHCNTRFNRGIPIDEDSTLNSHEILPPRICARGFCL